jgi:hypothetical protein
MFFRSGGGILGPKEKADHDVVVEEQGMEMEQLMLTPRKQQQRLLNRTNSSQNSSSLSAPPTPTTTTTTTRGNRYVREAELRGGGTTMINSRSVVVSERSMPLWIKIILFVAAVSIVFNSLEIGKNSFAMFVAPEGDVQDRSVILENKEITIMRKSQTTMSPTPVPQRLSVHEHNEALLRNNATKQHEIHHTNSFTTWLDFDQEKDPKPSKNPPPVSNGTAFANRWCNLRHTTWYPSGDKDSWMLRAPKLVLPGAAYSGTVWLASALHQHPHVLPARVKELQFFHERPFRKYVSNSVEERTLVHAARQRMYARDYNVAALRANKTMISLDASPGYLFYSSILPRRILCVEPWVKMVVLLRNPVDRVLEQYAVFQQQRGLKLSLESFIQQELKLMEDVGLIQTSNSSSSAEFKEDSAWYAYQHASVGGAMGRRMYVIQLQQWFQAFRSAGKQPQKDILVVRTERVAADPIAEYNRILQFLDLPPHELQRKDLPTTITHQTRPVKEDARQLLEDFFRPYNIRLKKLLRRYNMTTSAID